MQYFFYIFTKYKCSRVKPAASIYLFQRKYFPVEKKLPIKPTSIPNKVKAPHTCATNGTASFNLNIEVTSCPPITSYNYGYPKYTNKHGRMDPRSPIIIPSSIKGTLIYQLAAPTFRIMEISVFLA